MSTAHTVAILAVQNELLADVLAFALEECFPGLAIVSCEDPARLEGMLLRNPDACVVIDAGASSTAPEALYDLTELAEAAPNCQLLVLGDAPLDRSGAHDSKNISYLGRDPALRELVGRMESALKLGSGDATYCKITAERLLARGETLRNNVFLRLGKDKFVRVFRAGEKFKKADLDRLRAKDQLPYLYLVRNDFLDSLEEIFSTTSTWVRTLRRLGRIPLFRSENIMSREDLLIRLAFEDLFLLVLVAVAMVYILQFSLNRPMELPFLSLGPGPFLMNVWLMLAVLLPWSLIFDARALAVLALAATGAFARLNFRKVMELGKPIGLFDLQHMYMSQVLSQYVGVREAIAVLFFLCLPFALRFSLSTFWKRSRAWTVTFLYFVALACVFDTFFAAVCFEPLRTHSFFRKRFPPFPEAIENAQYVGYPLSTLLGLSNLGVRADTYSAAAAAEILGGNAEPAAPAGPDARNVVLVLLESFRDYSLDGLVFREDVIPFYRSLKARSKVGRFYSPSVGGGTANVGFEVLSGIPTAFLPNEAIVYEHYLDHFVPTIVSRLKNAGYQTFAVHNKQGENYRRGQAFPLLGFDHFFDEKQLKQELGPMPGERYPDRAVFLKSLKLFAGEKTKHQFQYLITYETHGPYDETPPKKRWLADPTIAGDDTLVSQLDTYGDRMNKLDADLAWYFGELAKLKNPPVVVLFGDHHPSMSLELPFGQRGRDHRVEGVLALGAPGGAKLYDGEKPIFCLSPLLLAEARVRPTRYFRYLEHVCRTHQFFGPLKISVANEGEYAAFRALGLKRLLDKEYVPDPAEAFRALAQP